MELLQMSVRTLSEKIRSRVLGVEEAVSGLQRRIEEADPDLGAFLTIDKEQIARRVEEVQRESKAVSIPVLLREYRWL